MLRDAREARKSIHVLPSDSPTHEHFFPTEQQAQVYECQRCCLLTVTVRAIAQAVSRWLPTAAARVRSRVV
jgi:hypothetical protein